MNFTPEEQYIIRLLQKTRNLSEADAIREMQEEQAKYDAEYEVIRLEIEPFAAAFNDANREYHAAPKKTRELTKRRKLATEAYEKAARRLSVDRYGNENS